MTVGIHQEGETDAILFRISIVFDAYLVGYTGMTVAKVFILAVTVDVSFYRFLAVFNKSFNYGSQIKTAIGAFLAQTVHVETGIVARNEVDRAFHQDGTGCLLIIRHAKHDARYTGQAVCYQTGGEHGVFLKFLFLFEILFDGRVLFSAFIALIKKATKISVFVDLFYYFINYDTVLEAQSQPIFFGLLFFGQYRKK